METVDAVGGIFDDTEKLAEASTGLVDVIECVTALQSALRVVVTANEAVQTKNAG